MDEGKTGIHPARIERIAFCTAYDLSPNDIEDLRGATERTLKENRINHHIPISIIDRSALAKGIISHHPFIAKEHLGISIDTGQILDPQDFVHAYNSHGFSASLSTNFRFRDTELTNLSEALCSNQVVLIHGPPGVGKTRLALEACRRFTKDNTDYAVKCIMNLGADLFEDVKTLLAEPGNIILLIDDANRISGVEYLTKLIAHPHSSKTVKAVVTVRSYALEGVESAFGTLRTSTSIEVGALESKEIRTLAEEEFGISSHLYLERIERVAAGNPRIAVMAARVAAESNTLQSISDVSKVYDAYFQSVRKDLSSKGDIRDRNLLRVVSIVAFLFSIDKNNQEQIGLAANVAGFSVDEFWSLVEELHDMEILDMYEHEIVRVSDQVLATYMFYLSLAHEKVLDFGRLLQFFFPRHRSRFIETLNPMFSAFDYKQIRMVIEQPIRDHYSVALQNDKGRALSLLESFWFVLQTESLIYAKEKIDQLDEPESIVAPDVLKAVSGNEDSLEREDESMLTVLGNFARLAPEMIDNAVELLLRYSAKDHSKTRAVVQVLTSSFGFEHDSDVTDFHVQHAVVDCVLRLIDEDRTKHLVIGLFVAGKYLGTHFESQESYGHSVTFRHFNVPATSHLLQLRDKCWKLLLDSYEDETMAETVGWCIRQYAQTARRRSERDVVLHDATHLIPFFTKISEAVRGPLTFTVSLAAHRCFNLLEQNGIPICYELRSRFCCMPYSLFLLSSEAQKALRFRACSMGEYDLKAKADVRNCFLSYSAPDYVHAAHTYTEIAEVLANDNNPSDVSNGIGLQDFVWAAAS